MFLIKLFLLNASLGRQRDESKKGERESTLKQTFCENVIISKLFLSCNSPWIYSPVLTAPGSIPPRWKYYTILMYEKSCESSIKSSRHKEGSRINCAIKLVITLRETSRWRTTFSFFFFFAKKWVRATVELIKILLTSLKRPPEQDERNKSLSAFISLSWANYFPRCDNSRRQGRKIKIVTRR